MNWLLCRSESPVWIIWTESSVWIIWTESSVWIIWTESSVWIIVGLNHLNRVVGLNHLNRVVGLNHCRFESFEPSRRFESLTETSLFALLFTLSKCLKCRVIVTCSLNCRLWCLILNELRFVTVVLSLIAVDRTSFKQIKWINRWIILKIKTNNLIVQFALKFTVELLDWHDFFKCINLMDCRIIRGGGGGVLAV